MATVAPRPLLALRRGTVTALLAAACLVATVAFAATGRAGEPEGTRLAAAPGPRPNIVLVVADDMRSSELRWMPTVQRLLVDQGVRLRGMLSNHPVCCPARAGILTGQYAQNHGVHHNFGEFGGYERLVDPDNHLGRWMTRAGYASGYVGKFLNRWEREPVLVPGWRWFDPIVARIYVPFGLTMYGHGDPRTFDDTYTTNVIGRRAVYFVHRRAPDAAPFFLWVNPVAPHDMKVGDDWRPPQPHPRYADAYAGSTSPVIRDPAFDEADVSDKPAWVQRLPRFTEARSTRWHLARIRSLRSVDDQVGALVKALRESRSLANTYVVFTSDNGNLLGEHRYGKKNVPYEAALQVPFVVRGPGVPRGVVRQRTFELIDLVPTLLQLAGASAGRTLDGRSMLPALRRGEAGKRFSLIQAGGVGAPWWWRGVRSNDYKYVRYSSGFEELYDLHADPSELRNVASRPAFADVLANYSAKLDALQGCSGRSCVAGTS